MGLEAPSTYAQYFGGGGGQGVPHFEGWSLLEGQQQGPQRVSTFQRNMGFEISNFIRRVKITDPATSITSPRKHDGTSVVSSEHMAKRNR